MSKQDIATARWETAQRMDKIDRLMADARDYSFPAGQMQAGLQLATVEVPWLLNYIDYLEARQRGSKDMGLLPQTA
jgi:hypothetical protein